MSYLPKKISALDKYEPDLDYRENSTDKLLVSKCLDLPLLGPQILKNISLEKPSSVRAFEKFEQSR